MGAIRNSSKKKVISKQAKLCATPISKAIGLMFSRKNSSLIMKFKNEQIVQLHMLFVFFQIDVILLDKDKRVTELKQNFRPFTFYTPENKSMFVIEVPAGTIEKSGTKVGDRVEF